MRKVLLSLLAVTGLVAFAGIASAECVSSHMTTASTDSPIVTTTGPQTPAKPGQSGG